MFPELEKTTVIYLKTRREGTGTITTNLKGFQQNSLRAWMKNYSMMNNSAVICLSFVII